MRFSRDTLACRLGVFATPDELAAVDDGLIGDAVLASELPTLYRAKAASLRRASITAETEAIRENLLQIARRFDELAEALS